MRKRRWFMAGGLIILLAAGLFAYWFDLIPLPEVEDGDYPMRPVSALAESGRSNIQYLASGQQVWWKAAPDKEVVWVAKNTNWRTLPDAEVKAYPGLESGRPLYGTVEFGTSRLEPRKGVRFCLVVDESAGTGKGYDRLYFDVNRDLDLTNDPVLAPMEEPPSPPHPHHNWGNSNVVFHPLSVPFDFGPPYGTRPVEILPRLSESDRIEEGQVAFYLVALEARKGKIQIGRRRYHAVLAQPRLITGRFDKPYTTLYLTTAGLRATREHWWGAEDLSAFRLVDGRFYTISTTPTGDTLMVRRYRGQLGIFRIDPGNRPLDEVAVRGSLRSDRGNVPVGELAYHAGDAEPVRECELPVGDYCPEALNVRYGRLRIFISQNYHADGKRQGGLEGSTVYGIQIRKDRPYRLDFSNKPEVMFVSPAKEQTFQPGDEVQVAAVLIDPVVNMMIRRLDDTSRKETRTIDRGGGQKTTYERNLSLDPVVAITDSSGKKVSEGDMPFG